MAKSRQTAEQKFSEWLNNADPDEIWNMLDLSVRQDAIKEFVSNESDTITDRIEEVYGTELSTADPNKGYIELGSKLKSDFDDFLDEWFRDLENENLSTPFDDDESDDEASGSTVLPQ